MNAHPPYLLKNQRFRQSRPNTVKAVVGSVVISTVLAQCL
jgi:hypothetical protein